MKMYLEGEIQKLQIEMDKQQEEMKWWLIELMKEIKEKDKIISEIKTVFQAAVLEAIWMSNNMVFKSKYQ